jgi:hypothetical protein
VYKVVQKSDEPISHMTACEIGFLGQIALKKVTIALQPIVLEMTK